MAQPRAPVVISGRRELKNKKKGRAHARSRARPAAYVLSRDNAVSSTPISTACPVFTRFFYGNYYAAGAIPAEIGRVSGFLPGRARNAAASDASSMLSAEILPAQSRCPNRPLINGFNKHGRCDCRNRTVTARIRGEKWPRNELCVQQIASYK